MSRITIDATLAVQLDNLGEQVELCDPTGKVLGQFIPAYDPSKWQIIGPELTEEELAQREKEESYSTAEVLAYLEKLPCSESAGKNPL